MFYEINVYFRYSWVILFEMVLLYLWLYYITVRKLIDHA